MEKPLIWIIDEEWPDYELEKQLLKTQYPDCDIRFSTYDYAADLDAFGENADAVICQVYAPMPAATIQRLKKCKIIAVYGWILQQPRKRVSMSPTCPATAPRTSPIM